MLRATRRGHRERQAVEGDRGRDRGEGSRSGGPEGQGLAYVGPLASGDAPAVRTILRRLNVERIVVIPDGPKGWRFESNVDLAGLLGQNGDPGGPQAPGSEAARRSRAALDGAYRDPGASKGA